MVKAMKVATGIEEEEYVDGAPRKQGVPAETSSEDELEEDHMEMAAMRVAYPAKPKKRKKKKTPRK